MARDKDENIVRDKWKDIDKHEGPEKGNSKQTLYSRYVTCQDQKISNIAMEI